MENAVAYKCPKCGEPVQRGYSGGAQAAAGLVGALFYAAFGAFECQKCGKLARCEFPSDVRAQMAVGSLVMVAGAAAIAAGAIWLLATMD